MKVTIKGQVTIPMNIRKFLQIKPHSEVEFVKMGNNIVLINKFIKNADDRFKKVKGKLENKFTTDEIMNLTRGDI